MRTVQSFHEITQDEISNNIPVLIVNKGYGELQLENYHYAQAIRIGNRVEISGQGGYDYEFNYPENATLKEEIVQSLKNVQNVLEAAGVTWNDVFSLTTYHVNLNERDAVFLGEQIRSRITSHAPLWTCIGVAKLADSRMRVEIVVSAIASSNNK